MPTKTLQVPDFSMNRINTWYKSTNWIWAALALLVATYAAALPQQLFSALFGSLETGPGSQTVEAAGFIERVFLTSIVAPMLETAVLQLAPVHILSGKFGLRPVAIICTSAALFAMAHTYSWGYVVYSFLIGLVFAYGYLLRNFPGGNAFLIVFSAHAARNLVTTIARAL